MLFQHQDLRNRTISGIYKIIEVPQGAILGPIFMFGVKPSGVLYLLSVRDLYVTAFYRLQKTLYYRFQYLPTGSETASFMNHTRDYIIKHSA